MAIFAKNIIIGGETSPPTEELIKPIPKVEPVTFKQIKETPIVKEINKPEIIEETPTYHEIHDGDLHKMINRKSTYLTDMLDLEK